MSSSRLTNNPFVSCGPFDKCCRCQSLESEDLHLKGSVEKGR